MTRTIKIKVFISANIAGIQKTYFVFIILQDSVTQQQSKIDNSETGIKTNIATVIPPKEFNPIKIAAYKVKYNPLIKIKMRVKYLNLVK